MPSTIQGIREKLTPVFEKYPEVLAAYLFGTVASGKASGLSDVDLAILVQDPNDFSFVRKLTIHGDCCRALNRDDIDLVVINQLRNLVLIEDIIRNGLLLRDVKKEWREDFELKMLHRACDFKYQRTREMGI